MTTDQEARLASKDHSTPPPKENVQSASGPIDATNDKGLHGALYDEHTVLALARHLVEDSQVRTHYYVKICVSAFLCALLLLIGVPVFMESRVTGSLAYTALGVVLVGFGLVLAVAVVVLLFHPPFRHDDQS